MQSFIALASLVSFRAVTCVDHKPLLLQLEFSKLTGADDITFVLG